MGDENEVFTPDYDGTRSHADAGLNFKVNRLFPWLSFGNAALVPQLLFKLSRFDLIHIHYPFFGGAEWILPFKGLFVRTPKIVLSYHMDVLGSGILKPVFKLYAKTVLPFLIRQTDAIILSTRDYGETSLISRYLDSRPTFVVPYGVGEHFHPAEKNGRLMSRLSLRATDKIILFVGGLDRAHYFKGVSELIAAVASLKNRDIKLLLVGNGNLVDRYRGEMASRGIREQGIIATGVSDQELPDYYNLADLVVLPSINRSEAFGIVLLEAMACARPVVASALPGVREIVEENRNGLLVIPGNIEDLAAKLSLLLDDRERRETFGHSGFKKVEEHYRWRQVIREVKRIYLRLAGDNS